MLPRHVKFSKKNVGQRVTTSFHPAIWARAVGSQQLCRKIEVQGNVKDNSVKQSKHGGFLS